MKVTKVKMNLVSLALVAATGAFAMNGSVASVIPAATELPVTATNRVDFQLGEEKELVFSVAEAKKPAAFDMAAKKLAGCMLHVKAKLQSGPNRLISTGSTFVCNRGMQEDAALSGKHITGQLVGQDKVAGLPLELVGGHWQLKSGTAATFVLLSSFNK